MKKKTINFNFTTIITLVSLIFCVTAILYILKSEQELTKISYNSFTEMIEDNKVVSVNVIERTEKIILMDSEGKSYSTDYPKSPTFREEMLKNNIKVTYKDSVHDISWLLLGIVMVYSIITIFSTIVGSFDDKKISKIQNSMSLNMENSNSSVSFKDVAGIDEAKESLMEIVDYLKKPNKVHSLGIKAPKGVLLEGPPGTGKTLLAKAVAGEANVPFYSLSGSDFTEMFVGVGASRVRELFNNARKNAPCVVFIDEIDSLVKKRSSSGSNADSERDQTINAFLVELDGFSNNDGVILIGATNRKDMLDPAVLRPGRFDRHVYVDLPDVKGREEILKIHGKNKPFDETVDMKKVAKITTGFSGADLENLLNESGWFALRNKNRSISMSNINDAFDSIIAGSKKKRNMLSKKEKDIVAFHESGHAIVTKFLAKENVAKVTIAPTGKSLGYVMHLKEEDTYLSSKNELFNKICICLAGREAESIIFGEENITTGASNDFKKATQIAYSMVFSYGMSDLGVISLEDSQENWLSEEIRNKAYCEVQSILKEAKEYTSEFIKDNIFLLNKLANKLLEVETLYSEEFDSLFVENTNVEIKVKKVLEEVLN